MEDPFADDTDWVPSALLSARLEQAALLRLLVKKKTISVEEFLAELGKIVSDEHMYSVRQFVAQSEPQLRGGRWHIGGAAATDELGRRLSLGPDDLVLDIGCGCGGPARQIAETFSCRVIGLDYRPMRIIEAVLRTASLGLTSRVSFQVGEGEHLPFEDETFDAVMSQAACNWIADKVGLIRETFRVLKPQGRLGFECEALTEKGARHEGNESPELFRALAWQQLLGTSGFAEVEIEEMWEESRRFYPGGPEREQIDQGERVNVRMIARKLRVEE